MKQKPIENEPVPSLAAPAAVPSLADGPVDPRGEEDATIPGSVSEAVYNAHRTCQRCTQGHVRLGPGGRLVCAYEADPALGEPPPAGCAIPRLCEQAAGANISLADMTMTRLAQERPARRADGTWARAGASAPSGAPDPAAPDAPTAPPEDEAATV